MTRVPKILVDARSVFRNVGGVGRAVLSTVREMGHMGSARLIVLNNHPEHWRGMSGVEVLPYAPGPGETLESRTWWEQVTLPHLVRHAGADAVWSPWNWGVPWVSSVPSLLTVHDLIPYRRTNPMGSRFRSWLYRANLMQSLKKAHIVVCISEFTRAEMLAAFPAYASKTNVIHWGVDRSFSPGQEQAVDGELRLLYVGGKEPRKNVATLLHACAQASDSLRPVRIKLALTGRESQLDPAATAARIQAGNRVRIEFLGEVEEERLIEQYRTSHVLVFPSLEEGFGFPPLEAQASGLPVICGTCDSIPEVVGEGAAFADVRDAAAMAKVIGRVACSSAERSDLRVRGLINARRFDWSRCAHEYLQLLLKLAYSGRRIG